MTDQRRRSTPLTRCLTALLTMVGVVLIVPTVAFAYQHTQNCSNKPAYAGCYDAQGQIYNPWTFGSTELMGRDGGAPLVINGTCIKAITQAGNNKSGDRCNSSFQTTTSFQASPDSQVYGYWGGSGGTARLQVIGRT